LRRARTRADRRLQSLRVRDERALVRRLRRGSSIAVGERRLLDHLGTQRVRDLLQPWDLVLRGGRTYQRVRRTVLALSVLTVVGMPFLAARFLDRAFPAGLVVGATGSIRVLGIELVDPLLSAGVWLARGARPGLLAAALPVLLLVIVLGRFFCGWLCPYLPLLALSHSVRWGLGKVGVPLLDLRLPGWLRFAVLGSVLAGSAALGVQLAALVYPPALLARTAYRLAFGLGLGGGVTMLAAVWLFDTTISRAGFCRSLCPGGALFSLLGAASSVRVRRVQSRCTDCTACDAVCNVGQHPMSDLVDAGCDRCGRCVAVCPTRALSLSLDGRPP